MKIVCKKYNLLKGLNIVSKAVPAKTTMSILQCILVDCTKGNIRLIANDTEIGIETIVEGEILEKGVVALDAKIFFEIIRKLPEDDVDITTDASYKTTIKCMNSKFNILGKSGDEFSYLPEIDRSDYITISQLTLREVIRQTIFSVSANDTNKIMTGIFFEIKNDRLRIISLDGHRISIRMLTIKEETDEKKVIIPSKTLNEISKIVTGESEDTVNIYFTDKYVTFEFDDTIVLSRIIEGEYFDVDRMLINDFSTKVRINKKDFIDCIERSTLMVKEGDKKPVIFVVNNDTIELKINSTIGSMNEFVDIDLEGDNITIGFNPRFLLDALRVIDDDEIDIYLNGSRSPGIIKDINESYIYLVLPININTVD